MADPDPMQAYYARDAERDRLDVGFGRVELARTIEIVTRTLPLPPAVVADIGGGPGRYTDWLVAEGYDVVHRDVVVHHVDQVRARHGDAVDAAVGDARDVDLPSESVDVVLLLGPLYHLEDATDRVAALREARRIVRPGGVVHAAAISRAGVRLSMLVERHYQARADIFLLCDQVDRDGLLPPLVEAGFCGYAHTPASLAAEVRAAGFEAVEVVPVEGVAAAMKDVEARLDDPSDRDALLASLRAFETLPDAAALTSHLLATARS